MGRPSLTIDGMRFCNGCNSSRPIGCFYLNAKRRGVGAGNGPYPSARCIDCHPGTNGDKYRTVAALLLPILKAVAIRHLGGKCVDCGYNNHPAALEFDHLGDKEFNIGNILLGSVEQLKRELSKCELVCATCHRIRTSNRNTITVNMKISEYEASNGSATPAMMKRLLHKLSRF